MHNYLIQMINKITDTEVIKTLNHLKNIEKTVISCDRKGNYGEWHKYSVFKNKIIEEIKDVLFFICLNDNSINHSAIQLIKKVIKMDDKENLNIDISNEIDIEKTPVQIVKRKRGRPRKVNIS